MAATLVLLGFDEASALCGLRTLMSSCCPGYHDADLGGLRRDAKVLDALARRVLPASTCRRLDALGVPLEVLAAEHLLALASSTWPAAAAARLWDLALVEGQAAIFASFLALLQLYLPSEEQLLAEEVGMPGAVEEDVDPVGLFRQAALRGVRQDLEAVLQQARALLPLVDRRWVEQSRLAAAKAL
mmetsp:Transcript_1604/g.5195  ORF Transcript_1604/g.5195 Transcript_1604/m.5195 type:complete len:186 (+) Transcript_1604:1-558(+)